MFRNTVILIIGGQNLIDAAFVQRFLEGGAKEVRIIDGNETTMQELREDLNLEHGTLNQNLRFFLDDLNDNTYLEEAVRGVDFVLYIPTFPRPFDCEVAPAVTTINFLQSVTGVLQAATGCKVKKLVVMSPDRKEPLKEMPDMLATLMETVVVAEARYMGQDSRVTICCARKNGNLGELAEFAFANAVNGDLLVKTDDGIQRTPCEHFDLKREN